MQELRRHSHTPAEKQVLRIYADVFIRLLDDLKQAELETAGIGEKLTREEFEDRCHSIGLTIRSLGHNCEVMQLRSAGKQVRFNVSSAKADTCARLSEWIAQLRRRAIEDLEDKVFLCIEPSIADYFYRREAEGAYAGKLLRLSPEMLCGHEVCSNFRSAVSDISEAADCLCFDKGTACVFHLMRVMETGLRALGRSLNDVRLDPKTNPSWENILKWCTEELERSYAKRSDEWRSDPQFFSDATANLRAVKDAWRNPTMHVEKHYDGEEAMHIWTTERAFIRHLATRLQE